MTLADGLDCPFFLLLWRGYYITLPERRHFGSPRKQYYDVEENIIECEAEYLHSAIWFSVTLSLGNIYIYIYIFPKEETVIKHLKHTENQIWIIFKNAISTSQ